MAAEIMPSAIPGFYTSPTVAIPRRSCADHPILPDYRRLRRRGHMVKVDQASGSQEQSTFDGSIFQPAIQQMVLPDAVDAQVFAGIAFPDEAVLLKKAD